MQYKQPGRGESMSRRDKLVFVVEPDDGARTSIVDLLSRAGYEVVGLAGGEDAVAMADIRQPDLVLLDVRLPGISGYIVCRQLKDQLGSNVGIILTSADRTEPFDVAAGLMLGADDYMAKPFSADELLGRIYRLVDRATTAAPRPFDLTNREEEVLRLLADGLDQRGIAAELSISSKTASTHIQNICKKLGVHSRAQAVAVAHRHALAGSPGGLGASVGRARIAAVADPQ
jgi:DNA-binding NarL/FixJ family response regulator